MRYTKSNDGKMRVTIKIVSSVRLTEEEAKQYNEMAQVLGYRDFREYAEYKRPAYEMMLLDDYHQNNGKP